jgi:hypothetical protein
MATVSQPDTPPTPQEPEIRLSDHGEHPQRDDPLESSADLVPETMNMSEEDEDGALGPTDS